MTAPTPPSPNTQAARLLDHLTTGKTINPLEAWVTLGIYRLADTVFQLRGLGYPIKTVLKPVQNRFGESCRVAEYHLSQGGSMTTLMANEEKLTRARAPVRDQVILGAIV